MKKINVAVNEICRIIIWCLKPTTTYKLYILSGRAPTHRHKTTGDSRGGKEETQLRRKTPHSQTHTKQKQIKLETQFSKQHHGNFTIETPQILSKMERLFWNRTTNMEKNDWGSAPGKQHEIWTLEDSKSPPGWSCKNKESCSMGNGRHCGVRMRRGARWPTFTTVHNDKRKMQEKRSFLGTNEVLKLINFWKKKGIWHC